MLMITRHPARGLLAATGGGVRADSDAIETTIAM
jgi:hypothetical protein